MSKSEDSYTIVSQNLGPRGRLVSGSKTFYTQRYPDHVTVFNANLILEGRGKVWHGDIDLTKDESQLRKIARILGGLYVLREMGARFTTETAPILENAVFWTDGKNVRFASYVERRKNRKLYLRKSIA